MRNKLFFLLLGSFLCFIFLFPFQGIEAQRKRKNIKAETKRFLWMRLNLEM